MFAEKIEMTKKKVTRKKSTKKVGQSKKQKLVSKISGLEKKKSTAQKAYRNTLTKISKFDASMNKGNVDYDQFKHETLLNDRNFKNGAVRDIEEEITDVKAELKIEEDREHELALADREKAHELAMKDKEIELQRLRLEEARLLAGITEDK